jgi:hypothetical protein
VSIEERNSYVYFHINPLKNEIFYVGKGTKRPNRINDYNRMYSKRMRSNFWKYTVSKYGFITNISDDNLTEKEAHDLEIFYIKKIGRRDLGLGTLVNLTDGGEGMCGYVMSDEVKGKISNSNKGKRKSSEHKNRISRKKIGYKHSEETKKKMSETRKGLRSGFIHSEESRKKMSESSKGQVAWNKGMSKEEQLEYKKNKLLNNE